LDAPGRRGKNGRKRLILRTLWGINGHFDLVNEEACHPVHQPGGSLSSNWRIFIMLWTIIIILVVLWLLGFLGSNVSSRIPKTGNLIHTLLVIALILIVLNLLGVI
jgi:hypothetical protein